MKRLPAADAADVSTPLARPAKEPMGWSEYLRPALLSVIWFTLLTGCVFPLMLLGIGQLVFPDQAAGSLVTYNGVVIGSRLIAQPFFPARIFPSASLRGRRRL
jgi:K+-transporting ATPase c subunit